MFSRLLIASLAGLILLGSCVGALERTAADNMKPKQLLMSAQLIIKFRNSALDPSRDDFLQGLSRDAKAVLVYIRPMSGGAHVFHVENISDANELAEVIKRLSNRQDVLYVEQDTIMKRQQKK